MHSDHFGGIVASPLRWITLNPRVLNRRPNSCTSKLNFRRNSIMKIIICGAGRVGQAIARHLEREDADVVVVDKDEKRLERVASELKVSETVHGNACNPEVLEKAGAKDCDIIVAVTSSDETNFTICHIASKVSDAVIPSKIARMREEHFTQLVESNAFENIVDVVIQPEIDVAKVIVRNFETPDTKFYCELADEQLKIIALKLSSKEDFPLDKLKQYDPYPQEEAPTKGFSNEESSSQSKSTHSPGVSILGFIDHESNKFEFLKLEELSKVKVKDENDQNSKDVYKPKDYTVYFTVKSSKFDSFISEFVGTEDAISRVLIVGAGHIGYNVAKELEKKKRVQTKLIENDIDVANRAAERLSKTSVLIGDGLDRKILDEAKVADTDCVLATTGDDKTNIMICLFAEHLEAKHSFAMINDRNLKAFSESTDIDTVVSLRLQTLSKVIDRIRGKNIHNTRVIEDGRAEILEGIVSEDSHLENENIEKDYLDKNIQLVAIVRENKDHESHDETTSSIYLPNDKLPEKFEVNDRVIMLCLHDKETVKKVKRKFSKRATS